MLKVVFQVAQLVAQVQAAQVLVNGVQRSVVAPTASNKVIISDNYLGSGTQCGPRTVTGWTKNIDYYRSDTAVETTTSFTTGTGIFSAQVAGWYKICAYSR